MAKFKIDDIKKKAKKHNLKTLKGIAKENEETAAEIKARKRLIRKEEHRKLAAEALRKKAEGG